MLFFSEILSRFSRIWGFGEANCDSGEPSMIVASAECRHIRRCVVIIDARSTHRGMECWYLVLTLECCLPELRVQTLASSLAFDRDVTMRDRCIILMADSEWSHSASEFSGSRLVDTASHGQNRVIRDVSLRLYKSIQP